MSGKKYIDADALELAYRRMKDTEGLGGTRANRTD